MKEQAIKMTIQDLNREIDHLLGKIDYINDAMDQEMNPRIKDKLYTMKHIEQSKINRIDSQVNQLIFHLGQVKNTYAKVYK